MAQAKTKKAVNVGILGFGTVGSGTARILLENARLLKDRLGFPVNLRKIADLDITRDRGIKVPKGVLTTNAAEVTDNPDVDIVVELIGGLKTAKTLMLRAIKNGRNVVTANKALLAEEGEEIFAQARKKGVSLGFEASVGGGIPIIKALGEGLVANNINAVFGIVNGTSNYILTKMTNEAMEFAAVLKEAQQLGYAEADPTLDVEGIDSAHKLTILASLAYGIPLSFKSVYTEGITGITPLDIGFASELGFKIKLLAIAKSINGVVELRVHPTMLPKEDLVSQVDGVMNAIYVNGRETGDTLYYGRGAGDMPTGSAVVSDIADIAKLVVNGSPAKAGLRRLPSPPGVMPIEDVESMYYFRFTALDRPGVLSKVSGVLGDNNISIASVIQKGRKEGEAVPLIILTHKAREKDVRKALGKIDALPVVAAKTRLIRVEGKE
ncbi:MAG: homoserine dehydrogenase [Nitrospiraceae bacterium]|nr:homoserine dehydrogenase [Nitrospiraceae bacterium]